MNRLHLYVLAALLAAAGLGLFFYKALVLHFPLTAQTDSAIWNVEARVAFTAHKEPVKVSLLIPSNTTRYVIQNDAFISKGYGLTTVKEEINRQAVWSIRKASGPQTLYYKGVARRVDLKEPRSQAPPPKVEKPKFEGAEETAAQALLAESRDKSADTDTMVAKLVKLLNSPQPDDNVNLLLSKMTAESARMDLAVKILALGHIPARVAHGIRLKEQLEKTSFIHWLEVYENKQWVAFDPESGARGVPDDYMPWWRGPYPVLQVKGGDEVRLTLSVSRDQEAAIKGAVIRGQLKRPLLLKFSLFSLPLHTQQVYRVLLMVPVGAFLLVILRNIVGVSTFGTFMPVLIALAFRETHLLGGILLFSLLVGTGLTVRFYLDRLKLLLVPRLASILIVVVMLMVLFSLFTHKIGLERGLSIALFPMVIMTMTIERMSIVWEERGPEEALKQGAGSLAAASIAYLVMHNHSVEHLVFVFPELLLLVLAATLLLGRYSGYRLLELARFGILARRKI